MFGLVFPLAVLGFCMVSIQAYPYSSSHVREIDTRERDARSVLVDTSTQHIHHRRDESASHGTNLHTSLFGTNLTEGPFQPSGLFIRNPSPMEGFPLMNPPPLPLPGLPSPPATAGLGLEEWVVVSNTDVTIPHVYNEGVLFIFGIDNYLTPYVLGTKFIAGTTVGLPPKLPQKISDVGGSVEQAIALLPSDRAYPSPYAERLRNTLNSVIYASADFPIDFHTVTAPILEDQVPRFTMKAFKANARQPNYSAETIKRAIRVQEYYDEAPYRHILNSTGGS